MGKKEDAELHAALADAKHKNGSYKPGRRAGAGSMQRVARARVNARITEILNAYAGVIQALDPLTTEQRQRVIRATSILIGIAP